MRIHHLRNATCVIESGDHHILIDPMLGAQGELPAFARWRHKPRPNPTIDLPANAASVLEKVTHCLITHSQTFGIRALQHTDHLDRAGERFLRRRATPVVCRRQDSAYLQKLGLNVSAALDCCRPQPFLQGEIQAIPARHGHGWIHRLMANGVGFFIRLPGEPSIYFSGDTVYTQAVAKTLTELRPAVAVVAAGSASLDVGGPILMPLSEILAFVQAAPGKVIANHLEALNHCPTRRAALDQVLNDHGLRSKVFIPDDGQTLEIAGDGASTESLADE